MAQKYGVWKCLCLSISVIYSSKTGKNTFYFFLFVHKWKIFVHFWYRIRKCVPSAKSFDAMLKLDENFRVGYRKEKKIVTLRLKINSL